MLQLGFSVMVWFRVIVRVRVGAIASSLISVTTRVRFSASFKAKARASVNVMANARFTLGSGFMLGLGH